MIAMAMRFRVGSVFRASGPLLLGVNHLEFGFQDVRPNTNVNHAFRGALRPYNVSLDASSVLTRSCEGGSTPRRWMQTDIYVR